MSANHWLQPADCTLLQPDAEPTVTLRPVQRLLELSLTPQNSQALCQALLPEILSLLQGELVAVLHATPDWPILWQHGRRPLRAAGEQLPRRLLGEILDRGAAGSQDPTSGSPAWLATLLSGQHEGQRVLLVSRARQPFSSTDLEYAVAAAHYLGLSLQRTTLADQQQEHSQRLETLLAIAEQLVEQRETIPLLEHIAEQAARLLRCERASIFLWDRNRQELVGRPALGLPGGELRLPDHVGVVGKVVHTGQVVQVDDVRTDPDWHAPTDTTTGFQTRNLLCVPLNDSTGQRTGALEVLNRKEGRFTTQDVQTLQALARQTVAALDNVREHEALLRSHAELEASARAGCQIIGASTAIVALRSTIARVARTDLPVLVLGESGTGKEVVARTVHYSSQRQHQPFIPVNCAAIAETLLESELFGHEKGAFTDAHTQRAGKFEAASGGTLFLDEIGDLSPGGQAKLLRVLEEKVVYRVGGSQPIPVDVRIISATNRNLPEAVERGKFREDLFYRLNLVTVHLPPLRERREDILPLAEHFLQRFGREAGRKSLRFSAEAGRRLEQHGWPGNIRELRNLIERVAYLSPNERIDAADLPFIQRPGSSGDLLSGANNLNLAQATDAFQKAYIKKAIERAGGNMSDAARLLGLHRPNLYRKMKTLEMEES